MIKETFDSDNIIVNGVLSGDISLADILKWESELSRNKYSVRILKILLDSTGATYDFKMEDIEHIKQRIIESLNKFDSVHLAAVHDNPYETAYSLMFNKAVRIDNFHHATFSDRENAINWLLDS